MKGLYALVVFLLFCQTTFSQTVTRYRNPWVELVRQISCRSVTCNFQETCDLQVVCTPFGDCGQRATCLQIPFPRNTVCPDPFTNAGPPYAVECYDDAGCQEPMVCCHSYAKSYCHMPPFSPGNGAAAVSTGNIPPMNIAVEPVSETTLMDEGTNGSPRNTGNTNSNTNGNAGASAGSSSRGSRSVVIARSDFFDPQGFRRQQRENWQNSVNRRRRQQINAINTSIRSFEEGLRDENEVRGGFGTVRDGDGFGTVRDGDGFRTSIRRNLNGGRLTVEISGQGQPGSIPFVDVNGVRVTGNTDSRPAGNGLRMDDTTRTDDRTGTGGRVAIRQEDREAPSRGILRNDGRQNVQPQTDLDGVSSGSPLASDDINNAQGPQGQPQGNQANVVQPSRGQGSRQVDTRDNVGGPTVRVNLHAGGGRGGRPMIRKVDLWRGHGFYGDRRRILGDVQFDGFSGFANRFRGAVPANPILR